jgi:hypothetical protein
MAAREGKTEGRRAIDCLLVQAFLFGSTWSQAAEFAKCSETTVHRRMKSRAFQAKLRAARKSLISRTVDRLSTLALQAANVLGELLSSTNECVRMSAARTLLESAFSARKIEELEARIAQLEGSDDEGDGDGLRLTA